MCTHANRQIYLKQQQTKTFTPTIDTSKSDHIYSTQTPKKQIWTDISSKFRKQCEKKSHIKCSLLNEAQSVHTATESKTPTTTAFTPVKNTSDAEFGPIPHMDFLEAIQDFFHGVRISQLRKKPAADLYDRVLAHRLLPPHHKPSKDIKLPESYKLLRAEC